MQLGRRKWDRCVYVHARVRARACARARAFNSGFSARSSSRRASSSHAIFAARRNIRVLFIITHAPLTWEKLSLSSIARQRKGFVSAKPDRVYNKSRRAAREENDPRKLNGTVNLHNELWIFVFQYLIASKNIFQITAVEHIALLS